jgi:DNA-binding FadR family transcriptional regulator
MSQGRAIFRNFISDALRNNPEWHRDAMEAICEGMARALEEANEQRARYDLAFRSALALASPDRLNGAIVKAIYEANMSPIERAALERAKAQLEGAENGNSG